MSENTGQPQTGGPLSGLRILDLSRILAGPTCTQLLGDLGADVIKVERPGGGDDTRQWGPPFVKDAKGEDTNESAYYLCANRNKRSLAVDIANPAGARLVKSLAAVCDVMIENFKTGGLAKYGLAYDQLGPELPGLVYCSITGFGQTGPHATRPGYDILAQGYGGIMSLTGPPDGEPMKAGVGIADVMCGMYASTAILAALRHKDQTGLGQHIDLALVDTQIAWLINEGTNYLMRGEIPERRGNQHPNIVPYSVFKAADGHFILAVGNDAQFARFCKLIGLAELSDDPRFVTNKARLSNRDKLIELLQQRISARNVEELLAAMAAEGIPGGPVNDLAQVFSSDQVEARGMKITMPHPLAGSGSVGLIGNPVNLSKTPVTYRKPPPTCGEHSAEIISDLLGEDALAQARVDNLVDE